jgi:hypothetical protein
LVDIFWQALGFFALIPFGRFNASPNWEYGKEDKPKPASYTSIGIKIEAVMRVSRRMRREKAVHAVAQYDYRLASTGSYFPPYLNEFLPTLEGTS